MQRELKTHVECYETFVMGSMNGQVEKACDFLKKNEHYSKAKEINLVGISQGGLVARSILEDCEISKDTKVRDMMTIGTPNMGYSDVPKGGCQETSDIVTKGLLCAFQDQILNKNVYSSTM
jgi:hypothetical protein